MAVPMHRLQNNIVLLENVHADLKQSTLDSASLRLDLQSRRMQGELPQILLHVEDVLPEASGLATISADLSGTVDNPAAAFQGASAGLNYGGTHIDSAEVAGRLEDKTSRSTRSQRHRRMAVSMLREH